MGRPDLVVADLLEPAGSRRQGVGSRNVFAGCYRVGEAPGYGWASHQISTRRAWKVSHREG